MVKCNYREDLTRTVSKLAAMAFAEDMPDGDVTAASLELSGQAVEASILVREQGVMVGEAWYKQVLGSYTKRTGRDLVVVPQHKDGSALGAGSEVFHIQGDSADVVAFERTILNFVGRGMGIAKHTRTFVELVRSNGCPAAVLDTRKTLPGYRYFDKYAVLCGGGMNHRMNLSDQILIKENHIATFGSVKATLEFVRDRAPKGIEIQIEVQSIDQLNEAIDAGCTLIMLDNFNPEQVHKACEVERGAALLEISGGMNLATISEYCHPKLDRISIGSLTHSVNAPDITLLVKEER